MKKILVIGMCGNSLFYKAETKELLFEEPGGKGYNQAVAISKLGGIVSFIGAVGIDESGKKCSECLKKYNVNDLLVKKHGKSTYANIFVDDKANNDVFVYNGVTLDLNDFEYIKSHINEHDIILLQNEINIELNKWIIDYSFQMKKILILNPAPAGTWFNDILEKINYITPNEIEAKTMFGLNQNLSYNEIIDALVKMNVKNTLVTLGANGCVFLNQGNYSYFESAKVKAIDTTGAGDMMNGTIAYGISIDMDIYDAIKLGIIACGYSVERRYVLDSYPRLKDIQS